MLEVLIREAAVVAERVERADIAIVEGRIVAVAAGLGPVEVGGRFVVTTRTGVWSLDEEPAS